MLAILRSRNIEDNDKLQETIAAQNSNLDKKVQVIADLKKHIGFTNSERNMEIRDFRQKLQKITKENDELKETNEKLLEKLRERDKNISALQIQFGVQAHVIHNRKETQFSELTSSGAFDDVYATSKPNEIKKKKLKSRKPSKIESHSKEIKSDAVLQNQQISSIKDENFIDSEKLITKSVTKLPNDFQENSSKSDDGIQTQLLLAEYPKNDIQNSKLILPEIIQNDPININQNLQLTCSKPLTERDNIQILENIPPIPQKSIHKPNFFASKISTGDEFTSPISNVSTSEYLQLENKQVIVSEDVSAVSLDTEDNQVSETIFKDDSIQKISIPKQGTFNEALESTNSLENIYLVDDNIELSTDQLLSSSQDPKQKSLSEILNSSPSLKSQILPKPNELPPKLDFLKNFNTGSINKLDFLKTDKVSAEKRLPSPESLLQKKNSESKSSITSRRLTTLKQTEDRPLSDRTMSPITTKIPESEIIRSKARVPVSPIYKPSFATGSPAAQSRRRDGGNSNGKGNSASSLSESNIPSKPSTPPWKTRCIKTASPQIAKVAETLISASERTFRNDYKDDFEIDDVEPEMVA
ncbi:hypothetical protein HK096_008514 [Nowakowskiella sp. JEL0078]|nr:hypothetical protein HK096_008514 [Nowakowskiella sp. JEL0078]